MPFQSEAQRRFMYSNYPDIADKWQRKTPKGAKLPKKKGPTMGKTSECIVTGVTKRSSAGAAASQLSGGPMGLALTGLGAGMIGTGIGYGASRLLSPSEASIENLKLEEQVATYDRLVNAVRARMAIRQARAQGI